MKMFEKGKDLESRLKLIEDALDTIRGVLEAHEKALRLVIKAGNQTVDYLSDKNGEDGQGD